MGKRGPKPLRAAQPIWSPELAYACGLMATDGCLYSDGRHMSLTSKDIDQLETLKRCLGINNKIGWKPSSYSGDMASHVQFGDVTLYRWLIKIGITPRKTFTIGNIHIPKKYFLDYLRGEFDGDGSSHAYWDARWRSSVSIYINFSCASKKHLEWLNKMIESLVHVSSNIRYGSKVYYLRFSKQKAYKIYQAMYYSPNIPYLKRKKEKLDRQWAANAVAKQGLAPNSLIRNGSILRIA